MAKNNLRGELPVIILGSADALTLSIGVGIGALTISRSVLFITILNLTITQVYSMANGERMAEGKTDWHKTLVMALVSLIGSIWVVVPFFLLHGTAALLCGLILLGLAIAGIGYIRNGKYLDTALSMLVLIVLIIVLNKFLKI